MPWAASLSYPHVESRIHMFYRPLERAVARSPRGVWSFLHEPSTYPRDWWNAPPVPLHACTTKTKP